MRIQELNRVMKDSQLDRLDHERHNRPTSLWNQLTTGRNLQIGLGVLSVAAVAGVGIFLARRHGA